MPARESPPRWSRGDSNPGPPPCKGGALPAKLRPPTAASRRSRVSASPLQPKRPDRVGAPGLEPGTSALSGPRSNRLSYAPAAGAHAPSSTAADRTRGPPGGQSPHAQDGARASSRTTRSRKTARPGRVRSTQQLLPQPGRTWRRRPPRHPWRPCQALPPSRDGRAPGLGAHRCRITTRQLDTGQQSDDCYSLERR